MLQEYLETIYQSLGLANLWFVTIFLFISGILGFCFQTKTFLQNRYISDFKKSSLGRAVVKKIIIPMVWIYVAGSLTLIWYLTPYANQLRSETEKITVGIECHSAKPPKTCPEKGFIRMMVLNEAMALILSDKNSVYSCIPGENLDLGPYREHQTTFQYCTVKNWSDKPIAYMEWPISVEFSKPKETKNGKKLETTKKHNQKIMLSGIKPNAEEGIDFYINNFSTSWVFLDWGLEPSVYPVGGDSMKNAKVIMQAFGNHLVLFPADGLKEEKQ